MAAEDVTIMEETLAEVLVVEDAKVASEAKEAVQHQEEKADFQTEHQDVLKALDILQDQEDQEEANDFR